ncbi:MAG TPA: hypothetical protein VGI13_01080 [Candidatus Acidoferrum sp.]
MADWKQITARIRRARTGKDPAGQLSNLFSKTRDAMVAFELARYFESTNNPADAGKWYLTAAERFRRSDWKTKAQESATRLGATVAAEVPAATASDSKSETDAPPESEIAAATAKETSEEQETEVASAEPTPAAAAVAPVPKSIDKKHRRGRRGGREHRPATRRGSDSSSASRESRPAASHATRSTEEEASAPARPSRSYEQPPEPVAPSLRGRSGDPGLASRLTQMEMNFRRLLTCDPVKLEEASTAPAGPGVWVLTDSDLSTYYYVEACQTLRVAIPNLLRSGTVRRGDSIKPQLADHLGIPETRVSKYLSDHCVVRWLQMDDGASHFAHFLVAVLHPTLNE